jgi:DNA-binding NarL/FixJ family response regulator
MSHDVALENASGSDKVKIFILGKPNLYIEGLTNLIGQNSACELVACVEPGKGCFEKYLATRPDTLLVHHEAVMQPMKEFFARFHGASPDTSILVFGANMSPEFLAAIMRSGAQGYINEDMRSEDLYSAIRTVSKGGLWLERRVFDGLVGETLNIEETVTRAIRGHMDRVQSLLSDREMQVFSLVLEGLSTRGIAERLHLSEQSVKLYLGRLFRKFDVTNRAQLILTVFGQVCPVSNLVRLLRMQLDKRRIERGQAPLIPDPLASESR